MENHDELDLVNKLAPFISFHVPNNNARKYVPEYFSSVKEHTLLRKLKEPREICQKLANFYLFRSDPFSFTSTRYNKISNQSL